MQYKDIITLITSFCTFLIGGALVYWRENRKSFQEKIFEYKYTAYKEIIEQIGMYYQDVFSLLAEYQEFEGTEEQWLQKMPELFREYYPKARELDRLYFKYLAILPEDQLNRLRDLTRLSVGHITNHYHYRSGFPQDSYDRLWDKLINFAIEARKDLSTDLLNSTLSKRLSQQFYPITLPKTNTSTKNEDDDDTQDEAEEYPL